MSYTQPTDRHGHEHVPTQEARAGQTTGHVRVILGVSTALAIIALGVVLFVYSGA